MSLSASTFERVVRARHALIAAERRLEALEDACPCERRCKCAMRPAIRRAEDDEWDALQHLRSCEDSWREFQAAFR